MRSRNYKSGFFTSEDVSELSFMGRLLFLGLIALADRRGVLPYKPRKIRAEVFPYDDVNSDDIEACVRIMCEQGMASLYVDPARAVFLHLTNFQKHQSISVKERRQSNLAGPLPGDQGCELLEGCGEVGVKFGGGTDAEWLRNGSRTDAEWLRNGSRTVTEHLKSEIGNLKSEGGAGDDGVAVAPPSADGLFEGSEFVAAAGAAKARVKSAALPMIRFVDGEFCGLTDADVARWEKQAPGVDVRQTILNLAGWLVDNPRRGKADKNIRRFLGNNIRREGRLVAERAAAAGGAVLADAPKAWKGLGYKREGDA